ncbi:olfactory receptor 5AR1-like [Engystomops pustulosus]|uniref:olfactory receptor 5AR1-like n=1 Tax=Engystomops pustulosus TaxID=76066 RepID=UPI003AFA150B
MAFKGKINGSKLDEFILTGFSPEPHIQKLLYVVFLLIYLITIFGNACVIFLVNTNPHLKIPMYYFISNLAFLDISYSSCIAPKTLVDLLSHHKAISYFGCATQLFFYSGLGSTESFLFAVMAYDRYMAICNPLIYQLIMQQRTCVRLVYGAYSGGFLHSLIETCCTFRLSFCASHVLHHFVCDFPPLLKISCMDTTINEIVLFTFSSLVTMSSILVIVASYISIVLAVMKISSTDGRLKAFSTCASHITAVILFYGTVLYVYLRPKSQSSIETGSVASVFYTMVIPMLNPLIYSMRNKDIKLSLQRLLALTKR